MDRYVWISVLDSRTTSICQDRDGEVYTFGEGPMPPAHMNCRSTIVGYDGTAPDVPASLDDWLSAQPDAEDLWKEPKPVTLDDMTRLTSQVAVTDGSVSLADQTEEFLDALRALIGEFDAALSVETEAEIPTEATMKKVAQPAAEGERVVMVDVAKVDAEWAKWGLRVEPAPAGDNFKLDRAKDFIGNLKEGDKFKAPQLGVGKDHLGFDDGRHRFAAMRDLGYKKAPVSMDKQSIRNARARGLLA